MLPEDMRGIISDNPEKLFKVFHLNVRSMQCKFDEIYALLESCNISFDALMFTETWYNENSDHFVLPSYDHFFLNRKNCRGGGVSIQVAIPGFEILPEFSTVTCDIEAICIKKNSNVFAVLYRPPSGNISAFLKFLDSLLSCASENRWLLTIGGDMNIDIAKGLSAANDFLLVLQSNGFQNLISTPTRVTLSSASVLDLFITNRNTDGILSGVINSDVSDHLPTFCMLNRNSSLQQRDWPQLVYRDISSQALEVFRDKISKTDWREVFLLEDSNKCYDLFIKIFKKHYLESFPSRTYRKQKRVRKPWITHEYIKLIKHKNKLFANFLKSRKTEELKRV